MNKKLIKISLSIISILFFSNCYLHHANIAGDGYGIKTIINAKNELKDPLPIRIEFDPREKEKIRAYLKRKGQNVEISNEMIDTYYSEEIISKFKNSKYFVNSPNANVKIKIVSSVEEIRVPLFSLIACIGTLGLFPAITRTYGRIEFNLFDSTNNKILKTFKYNIEHRQLFGFSSMVFGALLPSTSERFDHSQNERTFAVMRVAFNQFNIDLANEVGKDKNLYSSFLVANSNNYALFLDPKIQNKNSRTEDLLLSSIETNFIDHKLSLVERKKINNIISEIKLSQYGLTDAKRLEFGKLLSADSLIEVSNVNFKQQSNNTKLTFSIRCISVESGQIIWSETIFYDSPLNTSDENHVKNAIDKLTRELELKGVL